jgi:hypothetical protein
MESAGGYLHSVVDRVNWSANAEGVLRLSEGISHKDRRLVKDQPMSIYVIVALAFVSAALAAIAFLGHRAASHDPDSSNEVDGASLFGGWSFGGSTDYGSNDDAND